LLVIEAVDFAALGRVSEVLNEMIFTRTNGSRPFDQSYQLIAELQSRSLTSAPA
jgi:hypothetical protein